MATSRTRKVTVEITNYRAIYVHGEVKNGGEFPYKPGLTLRDAVAIAAATPIAPINLGAHPARRRWRGPHSIAKRCAGSAWRQPANS